MWSEAAFALNGATDFTCDRVYTDQMRPLGADLQTELFSSVVMVIKSIHLSRYHKGKKKKGN